MLVLDANVLIRAVLGRRVRTLIKAYSARGAPYREEANSAPAGRDEEDWPILAAALSLACGIGTEDRDFFGTGTAVWTTDRVEIYLKAEARKQRT